MISYRIQLLLELSKKSDKCELDQEIAVVDKPGKAWHQGEYLAYSVLSCSYSVLALTVSNLIYPLFGRVVGFGFGNAIFAVHTDSQIQRHRPSWKHDYILMSCDIIGSSFISKMAVFFFIPICIKLNIPCQFQVLESLDTLTIKFLRQKKSRAIKFTIWWK